MNDDAPRDTPITRPGKRRVGLISVEDRIDEIGERALEAAKRREDLERMKREDMPKPP